MQTRITIFSLSVAVYLLGLLGYSNHREYARITAEDPVALVAHAAVWVDTAEALLPEPPQSDKPAPKLLVPPPAPAPTKADPLIVATILEFNDDLERQEVSELASLIEKTSDRYGVDPLLVTALVSQESAFYTDAVSPVGAIGLGQLMPYTAQDLGVDPHVPAQNLDGCVRYLAQNLAAWAHTPDPISFALASYNAGPGAVAQYGGIPPYEETQNYVTIINSRYSWLLSRAVG
ncbi:MAG: lytic transglycosylase domain-containing protein [Vulcanimicrobiota bacterium]